MTGHCSKDRSVVLCLMLISVLVASCNRAPEGVDAFKASQQAAMALDHFHVELVRKTEIGEFKNSQSIDCSATYFYDHEATDLSPKGIESGESQLQGRPSAHHETDTLFVEGKTYSKNTSSWENPTYGSDDAHPDWFVSSMPRDPHEACASIKKGAEFGYVLYDLMIKANDFKYLGKQSINGHECFEYETGFPGKKYSDKMTTTQLGPNSSMSTREMVNTTLHSKVCLGTKDHLPYQVIGEDYTARYDYAAIQKLPVPVP